MVDHGVSRLWLMASRGGRAIREVAKYLLSKIIFADPWRVFDAS